MQQKYHKYLPFFFFVQTQAEAIRLRIVLTDYTMQNEGVSVRSARGVENKNMKTMLLACNWLMLLPHWCIRGPIRFPESNQHVDIENIDIITVLCLLLFFFVFFTK